MDQLFITPTETEKIAQSAVSQDSTRWVKEIIGEALKKFPELGNIPLQVRFVQKDIDKGYCVASIDAQGFSIPAIIKDWTLAPMDVIVVNGIMLPLVKETLVDLMQNPSAFASIAKGRKDLAVNVFESPLSVPSEYAGTSYTAVGDSNFIDKVSSFIEKKDYEHMLDEIARPENYAGFVKNNTTDVLDKLSTLKVTDVVDFTEAALSNLEIDRQLVVEDDLGNEIVKQANSKIDYTWEVPLTSSDLLSTKCASSKAVSDTSEYEPGNTYAIEDQILYLTKTGEYHMFDRAGRADIAENVQTFDVEGDAPNMGDHGCFIIGGTATKPFEIVGIQKAAGAGNYEVRGWDGIKTSSYLPLKGVHGDNVIEHEELNNTYYVPGNGKFCKLAGQINVTFDHIDSDIAKNYVERDDIGLYTLEGPGFSKYAQTHSVRDLDQQEAKWAAIHCGANEIDLEKIGKLVPNSHVKLAGDIKSPMTTDSLETAIQGHYDSIIGDIPTFQKVMVKEASNMADRNSVDAILSLGMLNKRNVMEYIALIPEYEQVLSELAKLLIAARLGLPSVVDADVKDAMESFARVVYALKGLASLVE